MIAMKLQFLGATNTVTGSKYLLTQGNLKVLVDSGLFQGFKQLRLKNWEDFPVNPAELHAVVLTHAHLDHSGYIPLLVKNGFRGKIFATEGTVDLCKILLPDSGYLQEEEARLANKRKYSKHNPALPLYTYEDAQKSLQQFSPVPWKTSIQLEKGEDKISVEFHPAGHLLGAASVLIKGEKGSIAFSGDLGRNSDPLVRNPDFTLGAGNLVVESTYGNRSHPEQNPELALQEAVISTHAKHGTLLIPSFAVGRAQLILYYLLQLKKRSAIPDLPVYLNSPMASQANLAFAGNPGELKISQEEMKAIWRMTKVISKPEESQALVESTHPAIIVAASGMATGGRVLHHLKSLLPHSNNTVLFVGFQAGGTRGDSLLRGADKIKIHGQYWPVKARILTIESLSGHADANEIMRWISGFQMKPSRVFVTHGEPEAADALRHRIEEELGIPATVPEYAQEVELSV
jgi:metallo-beta-lactamase family protein